MKTQSKLVIPPSEPVVTVTEIKDYLRVDESAEDTRILIMIKAATTRLEALSDTKFITQTWDTFADAFPMSYVSSDWWDGVREGAISELSSPAREINLPFGPMQAVISFTTFDDENTEYLFDEAEYTADTVGPFGRIALRTGGVWPSTVLRAVNGIRVRATYGFGEAADVPADIKLAVMQLAARMYEHRGDELPKVPPEVALLIEPYRRIKLGGC